jgi:hypothetical protein
VGSSLVKEVGGRIIARRIDLLEESTDYLSAALPHELTHVILKDRFASKTLPRWADEGMAILADTEAKQKRHDSDLQTALRNQTTFRAAELLLMEDYPSASRFGTFYGQSASLTQFLVARRGAPEFVDFIDCAQKRGFDTAVRECYGFVNLGDLDHQWRESVFASHKVSETVTSRTRIPSSNVGVRTPTTESIVSR